MKKFIITIIILLAIAAGVIATYHIKNNQEEEIKKLEQQVEYLKDEIVPMEFELSENTNSQIKLKAVFYNLNNEKAGSRKAVLNGDELHIDFKVMDFNSDNFLFFPYSLYTDKMVVTEGIKIFESYENNGFPEIYRGITELKDENGKEASENSKTDIINSLIQRFDMVKNGENDFTDDSHGVVIHDINSISKFKKGIVYKVICHPHTGTIEIVKK